MKIINILKISISLILIIAIFNINPAYAVQTVDADGNVTAKDDKPENKDDSSGNGTSDSDSTSSTSGMFNNPDSILGTAPKSPNPNELTGDEKPEGSYASCVLDGLFGDLICGFTSLGAKAADGALQMLGAFMKVPPLETNIDNPLYKYWGYFRNIANALFVIVLLIVIFMYSSGFGSSGNYSIQKLLPRIILSAILVNISFFLCTLAVDLSNILGGTIYDVMTNTVDINSISKKPDNLQVNLNNNKGLSWSELVSGGLVAAGSTAAVAYYGLWSSLIPILAIVLLTVIVVVITLLVRQALIILLIMISSMAFIAMILPNTRFLFEKWSSLFTKLLFLYPVVALIFGSGVIAMTILTSAANAASFPVNGVLTILAMGMQVIPLFFISKIMSAGGSLMATVQNKGLGFSSKPKDLAGKFSDRMRRKGDLKAMEKDLNGRNVSEGGNRFTRFMAKNYNRGRRRRYAREVREEAIDRAQQQVSEESSLEAMIAAGNAPNASPQAKALARHAKKRLETIKASKVSAKMGSNEFNGMSRKEAITAATDTNSTDISQIAASNKLIESGDIGAVLEVFKNMGNCSVEVKQNFIDKAKEQGLNLPFLETKEVIENFFNGTINAQTFNEQVMAPMLKSEDLTADDFASLDPEITEAIYEVVTADEAVKDSNKKVVLDSNGKPKTVNKYLDNKTLRDVQDAAIEATRNKSVLKKLGKQKQFVEAMAVSGLMDRAIEESLANNGQIGEYFAEAVYLFQHSGSDKAYNVFKNKNDIYKLGENHPIFSNKDIQNEINSKKMPIITTYNTENYAMAGYTTLLRAGAEKGLLDENYLKSLDLGSNKSNKKASTETQAFINLLKRGANDPDLIEAGNIDDVTKGINKAFDEMEKLLQEPHKLTEEQRATFRYILKKHRANW